MSSNPIQIKLVKSHYPSTKRSNQIVSQKQRHKKSGQVGADIIIELRSHSINIFQFIPTFTLYLKMWYIDATITYNTHILPRYINEYHSSSVMLTQWNAVSIVFMSSQNI